VRHYLKVTRKLAHQDRVFDKGIYIQQMEKELLAYGVKNSVKIMVLGSDYQNGG